MTLPSAFDVTLEFLSDWHIGTGEGRLGTIDAEVRRDHDGLPFVPAKTLVGVWRDACETVAATLDAAPGQSGAWGEWVAWLFGTQAGRVEDRAAPAGWPIPAALRLTPARIEELLREAIRDRRELAQATVVSHPGIRLDEITGTAADRMLRVEERAIRGLRLRTRVSVDPAADGSPEHGGGNAASNCLSASGGTASDGISTGDSLPEPAELLLRAGARLVDAIGGKRNRGSGRVAVLLPGSEVDLASGYPAVNDPRLIELLSGGVPAAPPPPPAPPAPAPPHEYGSGKRGARRTVRLVLRVITPVVVADEVVSNIVTSRDMIPGTALLGTVLSRVDPGPGGGPIRLGDVAVGDAVPAIDDPDHPGTVIPTVPVPQVWHRSDKGRGKAVFNTLVGRPDQGQRAKPMPGRVAPVGNRWLQVSTEFTVSTHAVVDDKARRPTITAGGVYTYLGIAPGTLLSCDIVLPAQASLRFARGEQLRFGRSRKDDFGLVEVVADVIDVAPRPAPLLGLMVWCVSDVLLRDERLAPDPSPRALALALSEALAPATVKVAEDPPPGTETVINATTAVRREGFGVAWGRPRASQVALRAGSVVSLTVTGTVAPAQLAELERDGIGERVAEGYGRIRFNPRELAPAKPMVDLDPPRRDGTAVAQPGTKSTPPGTMPAPAGTPAVLGAAFGLEEPAHPIEINAWRRAIRRASARLEPHDLIPGINRLSGDRAQPRAQLGALRSQLERLALPGGEVLVRAWLDSTEAVPDRRKIWSEEVLSFLRRLLLDDPDLIWTRLGLTGPKPDPVPGRERILRETLRTEALVTAVTDAVRQLTHNRRRRDAATRTEAGS